ncbi:MAG: hypothetical protein RLY86_2988 [Pseudomonadota bacterium]
MPPKTANAPVTNAAEKAPAKAPVKGAATGGIASMTGFARAAGDGQDCQWVVEVRSVNGKSLDLRCRMPPGHDAVEAAARAGVAKALRRGNVSLGLTVQRTGRAQPLRLNRDLLREVLAIAREMEGEGAAPPRIDALLSVRGIIDSDEVEETEEQRAARETAIIATVTRAIADLAAARAAEGSHLRDILLAQVAEIERLTAAAAGTAALQPETLRQKLRAQLAALTEALPAIPEERLAQEAALLIARADVREELDRLHAHIAQARSMLAEGGAVGRRLDFLCQEFNREANTLCSKSADVELTRIGLDLKATIEQFREQVQNIE